MKRAVERQVKALTNVAQHAQTVRRGSMWTREDSSRILFQDNRVGSADVLNGQGLTGLTDRLEARRGTMAISGATRKRNIAARHDSGPGLLALPLSFLLAGSHIFLLGGCVDGRQP
jgi:hypothetical protein